MTVNPGYPDYARTVSQSGVQLAFNGLSKNAGHTIGVLDCLGFAFINIEIQDFANPGNTTVKVDWLSAASAGLITGSQYFTPVPACNMTIQLPTLSRYCNINISTVGAGQSGTTNYFVYGNNQPSSKLFTSEVAAPLIYASQSVNAAATLTVTATQFATGPATWTVFDNQAATFLGTILYFDASTNAFRPLAFMDSGTVGVSGIVKLSIPPAPIQLQFQNQGGAACTATLSLTMDNP